MAGWNLELGDVNGGSGYYNMAGGSLFANEIEIGNNGYGYYNQTAGSVTVANWLLLARAGSTNVTTYGVANVSGGRLIFNGGNNFSASTFPGAGSTLLGAAFTVSNTGFVSLAGNGVLVGTTSGGESLNLTGGTLQSTAINYNTGIGSINFNGGLLVAAASSTSFITPNTNISTVVYANGGTISNNGLNIAIPAAPLAPTGSGVSNIQVSGTGFTAPPLVYISDASGTFATGVATINSSGSITGVTITNPGINYTSPTLTLLGGGGTLLSSTISLASQSSGGMTFSGTGTTVLAGANTYSGPTNVTSGVLMVNGNPTGGGNYSIASGATLGGSGTITGGGTVAVSSGATLATDGGATVVPGNLFTLSVPSLALANGASSSFNLSGTNTNGFAANDQMNVANNLSLSGTTSLHVNVIDNGGVFATSGTSVYDLFNYGTLSGFTSSSFTLANCASILYSRQVAQFVNNSGARQIDLDIIGVAGNLTWVGSNGASWDTSNGSTSWFNNNSNSNDKFVNGDNVTFAAASAGPPLVTGSGAVTINGAVSPASINVTGGNYTFSGTLKITGVTALSDQ